MSPQPIRREKKVPSPKAIQPCLLISMSPTEFQAVTAQIPLRMSRKIRRAKRAIWLMLKRFMVSAFPLAWTGGAGYRSSDFRILSQIRPPERSNLATAGNRPGAPSWLGASHECGPIAGRKSAMRHKGSVGLLMTQLLPRPSITVNLDVSFNPLSVQATRQFGRIARTRGSQSAYHLRQG